jgi:spoIIIJ-associated protein
MDKAEIQNLIKELIEKTTISVNEISITEDGPHSTWFSVLVKEPHFFIGREGEGLYALNHLIRRIFETRTLAGNQESKKKEGKKTPENFGILIDINGFQKKRVENIRAIAHMMSERAKYFKSNIEVDPMSAFERRIVHEFLSNATDIKTESVGLGSSRRVVIKYTGNI